MIETGKEGEKKDGNGLSRPLASIHIKYTEKRIASRPKRGKDTQYIHIHTPTTLPLPLPLPHPPPSSFLPLSHTHICTNTHTHTHTSITVKIMRITLGVAAALALASTPQRVQGAGCPFAAHLRRAQADAGQEAVGAIIPPATYKMNKEEAKAYRQAAEALDWNAVKEDIKTTLTTSQDFWPADFGNYGPLMIRLAWHCAGSYRQSDGLGGCDGGRNRFDPERSWPDNTNLDKARRLLAPIKEKYGVGLSWGDLIILTGNTAIESMGGPVLGFCAGRMDDNDGTDSLLLGLTPEQEAMFPCPENGKCEAPLGASTMGLIYVNPEGVMGEPIPDKSAVNIREVFARMAMNDTETVALIGGGHAFGKTHGACPDGAGPSPMEDPENSWPGNCGTGKGADAFTSGFEGAWTPTPTKWSNTYFQELLDNTWEVHIGPGGHNQWKSKDLGDDIMMLTTDVSLLHDPKGEYQKIVRNFADDQDALDKAFSHAWYKLTTRDMGPVSRCIGPDVPPAQPFQNPLPPPPAKLADMEQVKAAVRKAKNSDETAAAFSELAWQCASTFRNSDYQGGCNGARVRFAPEKDWPVNAESANALKALEPVKKQFGEELSWSDLIVVAGTVALEDASGQKLPFCPGRTDAKDGAASAPLTAYANYNATAFDFKWKAKMLGLSNKEMVALAARPRSAKQMQRLGYKGAWSADQGAAAPEKVSNAYFTALLNGEWVEGPVDAKDAKAKKTFKAKDQDLYMTPTDMLIKNDAELVTFAQEYANDNAGFLKDFTEAWNKVMINDRFEGPNGNVCQGEMEVPAI